MFNSYISTRSTAVRILTFLLKKYETIFCFKVDINAASHMSFIYKGKPSVADPNSCNLFKVIGLLVVGSITRSTHTPAHRVDAGSTFCRFCTVSSAKLTGERSPGVVH